jgi:hypothetical protein
VENPDILQSHASFPGKEGEIAIDSDSETDYNKHITKKCEVEDAAHFRLDALVY